jgi:hypothetical protein
MVNGDFSWVGEICSIETNFGCNKENELEAQKTVNYMLKDGWRLLTIVNDAKMAFGRGEADLQVTRSYFVLGRSK